MERRLVLLIAGVDVRLMSEEQLDQLAVAFARGNVQRGFAGGAPRVDVGPVGEQQFGHFPATLVHGHVQGGLLAEPPGVDLGVLIQQDLGDCGMPLQGGDVQRRIAVLGPRLRQLGIGLEESLDVFGVTRTNRVEYIGGSSRSAGECQRQCRP